MEVNQTEAEKYSPIVSTARAIYTRSPFVPVVKVVAPQVVMFGNAAKIGVERIRNHLNFPTAMAGAMMVMPLGLQRDVIRSIAACGLCGAAFAAAREARLESTLPSVDPESKGGTWAVVTGCGERAGLGASVARALAARGFGVVVVAAREADAKVVARRLRLDHGAPCVALGADFDADALASVHTLRVALRHANLTAAVDVVVHAPENAFEARASLHEAKGWRFGRHTHDHDDMVAPAHTAETHNDDDDPRLSWDAALQARCGAATHLAHLFGPEMAARGRGRCAFVVGGAGAELNAALSSAQPPDTLALFNARSSFAASDAYSRALAKSLRSDLARFGVGVTLANKDPPISLRLPFNSRAPGQPTSPGDLLVNALLRGDKEVVLTPSTSLTAKFLPRFVPVLPGLDHLPSSAPPNSPQVPVSTTLTMQ